MKPPSKAERVAFWKFSYARSSFIQADLFSRWLVHNNPGDRSIERQALTYAIVTAYARPFKQRKEVKLSTDIVPPQYLALHDGMIDMRDKIIAHRDLDGPIAEWGFVSQVMIDTEGTSLEINTLSPIIENKRALVMLPMFAAVVSLIDEQIRSFLKYLTPIPVAGRYVVSLDDEPAEWLQPATPMGEGLL